MEFNNLTNATELNDKISKLKKNLEEWRVRTKDFLPEERRRNDNTDCFTGVNIDNTKLPDIKEH